MSRRVLIVPLLLAVIIFAGLSARAEESGKSVPQTTCPVMGGKIDKRYYADFDGSRVYFCCPMCVNTFKADPEKYIKKLEDGGVTLDSVPGSEEKK